MPPKAKTPAATPAAETESYRMAPVTAMVPLSLLDISPLNARQDEPDPADIAALADSIRSCGLMQNLMGYQPEGAERIGIVAGGRRLRALRLIAEGADLGDPMVPVQITAQEVMARTWAAAENTGRMALSPADEIRAYDRMAQSGATPATIARAFAVTERHVNQRLRLASLPDTAIAALRARRITLDQAAALTTARTEGDLDGVLTTVLSSRWEVGPTEIRNLLAKNSVSATDRRAVFVGLDRYTAAGGELQTDLFTDRTRLLDEPLLDRLFAEALTAEAERRRAEGWSDIRCFSEAWPDYNAANGMTLLRRHPIDLPPADADELDDLLRLGELDELTEEQANRLDELENRAAGDFAEDDISAAVLWIYVDREGQLQTFGPYRPPTRQTGADGAQDQATSGPAATETRALPESLRTDLSRIRLAALQKELADCPTLMIDLLGWLLDEGFAAYASPLAVTLTAQPIDPEKPEGTELPDRLTSQGKQPHRFSTDATWDRFDAWQSKPESARRQALATCLARAWTGNGPLSPHLAARLAPETRRIWTPTAQGYLSRLPGPALDAIWAELVPAEREPTPAKFRALKKAEKVNHLHRLFNDADFREAIGLDRAQNAAIDAWLPAELQWPEVEIATADSAPADQPDEPAESAA